MNSRRSTRVSTNDTQIPDEAIFFCAIGVLGYSLVVPLLALESLLVAESFLRFGFLHQAAIVLLLLLSTILLLGRCAVEGWKWQCLLTVVAACLLLGAVKPANECCSSVVAWIAGTLPTAELYLGDVVTHLMPIVGSCLLLLDFELRQNDLRKQHISN